MAAGAWCHASRERTKTRACRAAPVAARGRAPSATRDPRCCRSSAWQRKRRAQQLGAHRSCSRKSASCTHGGWSATCGPSGDAAAAAGVSHTARGTLSTVSPERRALRGTRLSMRSRWRSCGTHRVATRPRPSATAAGRTAVVSTPCAPSQRHSASAACVSAAATTSEQPAAPRRATRRLHTRSAATRQRTPRSAPPKVTASRRATVRPGAQRARLEAPDGAAPRCAHGSARTAPAAAMLA